MHNFQTVSAFMNKVMDADYNRKNGNISQQDAEKVKDFLEISLTKEGRIDAELHSFYLWLHAKEMTANDKNTIKTKAIEIADHLLNKHKNDLEKIDLLEQEERLYIMSRFCFILGILLEMEYDQNEQTYKILMKIFSKSLCLFAQHSRLPYQPRTLQAL